MTRFREERMASVDFLHRLVGMQQKKATSETASDAAREDPLLATSETRMRKL